MKKFDHLSNSKKEEFMAFQTVLFSMLVVPEERKRLYEIFNSAFVKSYQIYTSYDYIVSKYDSLFSVIKK